MARGLDPPQTARSFAAAYLETPEALLGTLLLDRAGIEAWAADAPPITDERPRMEFFRNQGDNMRDREIATLLEQPQAGWSWVQGLERESGLAERIERENRALRLYVRAATHGDREAGREAARLAAGTEFLLYPFGCAAPQLEQLRATYSTSRLELVRARPTRH